jgi:hypothetical protein
MRCGNLRADSVVNFKHIFKEKTGNLELNAVTKNCHIIFFVVSNCANEFDPDKTL